MVVQVAQATCSVRLLAVKGGISRKEVEKNGLPCEIVNKKMTRSFPVPHSFFLGARVMRRFGGKWYVGKVTAVDVDEGEPLWQVVYEDFDSDQMSRKDLAAHLVYHPLLHTSGDLQTPALGQMVWFSQDQQPVLGKVVSVDPSSPRPIALHVYISVSPGKRLHLARFGPSVSVATEEPVLARITLHQILLEIQPLTSRGYLSSKDRRRLVKCLSR